MSNIDLVLLGLIKQKSQSAYDIKKNIEYRNIPRWVKISEQSIYKKVLQLESKEYIVSHKEKEGNMPDKAVYTTNKVNNQLELWHNNYINKLGIDVDKHRKKGSLFKVREKTIGLIKEDWNYNKVEDSTIKQISSQIEPKKYNKLISDKKDDVILIQKYKGNYYNVPNDNTELEISED